MLNKIVGRLIQFEDHMMKMTHALDNLNHRMDHIQAHSNVRRGLGYHDAGGVAWNDAGLEDEFGRSGACSPLL